MGRYDVGIVGAGIAGLSLAWHLQRAGKRVVVLEQSAVAMGASVRNFGMLWIIGQPTVELHDLALRSRELWAEAADTLGFWIQTQGSLTLAYEPLELEVLREYMASNGGAYARELLSPGELSERFPFVRSDRLQGGIYSPTEAGVDPREVVHQCASALSTLGVDVRFDCAVSRIQPGQVELSSGDVVQADKIVVCPGPALYSLYPAACQSAGLLSCQLQMLRLTAVSGDAQPLGIHLCAGLTLGHYANFRQCPSLPALREFHLQKWPEQMKQGIHVLVAEHADGTITVGDSHAYGRGGAPYRDDSIDEAILDAMDEFLPRNRYQVTKRWTGTYNTHATLPYWWQSLGDSIWGLNLFGTGMTLSFGLTERLSQQLI
ncbi:MAG: TIGR03364 family FAD-dependent oxidoreductase [Fimbriimonadaceae bacterium]